MVLFIVFSSFLLLVKFFWNIPHTRGDPAKYSKFDDDLVLQGVLIRGVPYSVGTPHGCRHSENAVAYGSHGRHLGFPKASKTSYIFLNFSKTCLTSGLCHQSNIFLFAPPIFFILCSNRGTATLSVQYKSKTTEAHLLCGVSFCTEFHS